MVDSTLPRPLACDGASHHCQLPPFPTRFLALLQSRSAAGSMADTCACVILAQSMSKAASHGRRRQLDAQAQRSHHTWPQGASQQPYPPLFFTFLARTLCEELLLQMSDTSLRKNHPPPRPPLPPPRHAAPLHFELVAPAPHQSLRPSVPYTTPRHDIPQGSSCRGAEGSRGRAPALLLLLAYAAHHHAAGGGRDGRPSQAAAGGDAGAAAAGPVRALWAGNRPHLAPAPLQGVHPQQE